MLSFIIFSYSIWGPLYLKSILVLSARANNALITLKTILDFLNCRASLTCRNVPELPDHQVWKASFLELHKKQRHARIVRCSYAWRSSFLPERKKIHWEETKKNDNLHVVNINVNTRNNLDHQFAKNNARFEKKV